MPLNLGDGEVTTEEDTTPPVAEDGYIPPAQPEVINDIIEEED